MTHCACFPNQTDGFDLLIKLATLAISIIAIAFTAISVWLQRKHNQNAVKPIANFSISDYEGNISVKICNNGTGPLVIKSFNVTDGKKSKKNLISWMPELPENINWFTFFDNLSGFAITPNKNMNLLQLKIDPQDPEQAESRDLVRKSLAKLTMELTFEDIYGRQMPINKKSLQWYGRHFKKQTEI
ncbi:MAG: hypothetical protein WC854_11850 [Bacteroidales bacterium]